MGVFGGVAGSELHEAEPRGLKPPRLLTVWHVARGFSPREEADLRSAGSHGSYVPTTLRTTSLLTSIAIFSFARFM